jgi:alginate O-acetyltransferase complex protein AlgI
MLFSSVTFLFFFLPIVLTLYLPPFPKWRSFLFVISCFVFYAWSQGGYILALFASIFFNYLFGLWIGRLDGALRVFGGRVDAKKALLSFGLAFNLLFLALFKYTNFLVINVDLLLNRLGMPQFHAFGVYAPLGISFFTFHAISYLVDIYRGDAPVQRNPGALAIYMAAFPKVLAGPIWRYRAAAHQLDRPLVTVAGFACGIERFITGLAKKVLLANPLGVAADAAFGLRPENLAPYSAWAGVLCYTLEIYFDFSGYSDMAIGLGKMFGFEFPENFNFPYISQSVREFWRRWHISLSLWFKDYLYIPLGGDRRSPERTCLNLLCVFLLCGLWHGANWTFIIWGAWYGIFLFLERTRFGVLMERAPRALRHLYLMAVVIIGWVFFRADSVSFAFTYLKTMFGLHCGNVRTGHFAVYFNNEVFAVFAVAVLLCLPASSWIKMLAARRPVGSASSRGYRAAGFYVPYAFFLSFVFFVSILSLAGGTHKAFIYFRF